MFEKQKLTWLKERKQPFGPRQPYKKQCKFSLIGGAITGIYQYLDALLRIVKYSQQISKGRGNNLWKCSVYKNLSSIPKAPTSNLTKNSSKLTKNTLNLTKNTHFDVKDPKRNKTDASQRPWAVKRTTLRVRLYNDLFRMIWILSKKKIELKNLIH